MRRLCKRADDSKLSGLKDLRLRLSELAAEAWSANPSTCCANFIHCGRVHLPKEPEDGSGDIDTLSELSTAASSNSSRVSTASSCASSVLSTASDRKLSRVVNQLRALKLQADAKLEKTEPSATSEASCLKVSEVGPSSKVRTAVQAMKLMKSPPVQPPAPNVGSKLEHASCYHGVLPPFVPCLKHYMGMGRFTQPAGTSLKLRT